MLKRTLGLSLITLLVVTGLAGTIDNSTISGKERKSAIHMMKETRSEVLNSVKSLSAAQLDYRAAEGKWTIRECIYHIAASEKMLWSLLETNLKNAATPEKRAEIKVTDEGFVQRVKDRSNKVKTSEPLQPQNTGYHSLDEALEDFKTQRANHIKYVKSTTENLRDHTVQMPFGVIDCYQLCLMIPAHTNRHVQQIDEVKADPGFPKN